MNEGKEILITVINSKLQQLSEIDTAAYYYNDINLVELSSELKSDYYNFGKLSDEFITEILNDTEYTSVIESLKLIRDLIYGKTEYDIDIKLTDNYKEKIKTFIDVLDDKLEKRQPGITSLDEIRSSCNNVIHQINNHEIIEDTEFIKTLVEDYDPKTSVENMLKIMIFITRNNINIANEVYTPSEYIVDPDKIVDNRLDDRISLVLDRLGLTLASIPEAMLKDLRNVNINSFVEVYNLVRKNKVEKYGILHLIDKDNNLAKLALLIYSSTEAIKNVCESLKSGSKYIETLKYLLNYAEPIFFVKDSNIFEPHYYDFIMIIDLLKTNRVNYHELLIRCPYFFVSNYKDLKDVLSELSQLGFEQKKIINRCYKQLAINPYSLVDNANVLKTFGINIPEYASDDEGKYVLLKASNLYMKLNYIVEHNHLDYKNLDYNLVGRLMLSKMVKECNKKNIWGDTND